MRAAGPADGLAEASSAVARVSKHLENPCPACLEDSAQALQAAIAGLNLSRDSLAKGATDGRALEKLHRLRADLRQAGRLLESAAEFYRGWERILGSMSGGYTAGGEPAPVVRTGKLSCQG